MQITDVFAVMLFFFAAAYSQSSFTACDGKNSDDVKYFIRATEQRLIQLQHVNKGWTNTPEVVLALQLGERRNFFQRRRSIQVMKKELRRGINRMDVGQLASYVLAVKSLCLNPQRFAGWNLIGILDKKMKSQFSYKDSKVNKPRDGYSKFALALGALCVSGEPVDIKMLVQSLKSERNFGGDDSIDDANQLLLALRCVKSKIHSKCMQRKVDIITRKLIQLLKSKVKFWNGYWIGNESTTPSSVLALKETALDISGQWKCREVMKSLNTKPSSSDGESELSRRLLALNGFSYLTLGAPTWKCVNPGLVPPRPNRPCDLKNPKTCFRSAETKKEPS